MLLVGASGAGAALIDLTPGRGTAITYDQAIFMEFTEAMQTGVSSGTGVIEPFLTIQKNSLEKGFNSDAFPVLNATRPAWNRSIQISDLVTSPDLPAYYEFLLDINEPSGKKSAITQHALQVYLVPNSIGGAIATYTALQSSGTKIWDLDSNGDNQVLYDYNLWKGSGQNIDAAFLLPTSLFSDFSVNDYVYLYTEFGTRNHLGLPSQAGFEEYALRERGAPVPEPATMLLLGSGLIGLAGFCRKKLIK
jgi:PEP-CTERM motif